MHGVSQKAILFKEVGCGFRCDVRLSTRRIAYEPSSQLKHIGRQDGIPSTNLQPYSVTPTTRTYRVHDLDRSVPAPSPPPPPPAAAGSSHYRCQDPAREAQAIFSSFHVFSFLSRAARARVGFPRFLFRFTAPSPFVPSRNARAALGKLGAAGQGRRRGSSSSSTTGLSQNQPPEFRLWVLEVGRVREAVMVKDQVIHPSYVLF
jgi:hypothetical protein